MADTQFNRLMTHTITLKKMERDAVGDFSVVESTSLKGFVEYGNSLKIVKDDEEINVTAIVYLKDDCGISIDYPYWQIDQTYPQTRTGMQVLKIDPIDDPRNGQTHHYEVAVR